MESFVHQLRSRRAAVTGCGADDSETWSDVVTPNTKFKGTHFSLYGLETEAGQHYFHWLNPGDYGPFDHILDRKDGKQADMLSLDKDGEVDKHCADDDINGDCGHTHYQFKAVDENGNTVASERVETNGEFKMGDGTGGSGYYRTVFTAESGDLTLTVSLGRMVGGKYKAMSDTASVMFEAPSDLRALDQRYDEYKQVNVDIAEDVDEVDDIERYLDSVFAARTSIPEQAELFKNDAESKEGHQPTTRWWPISITS